MKKTLYEILGVESAASKEQIEAAYIARIDELKTATMQDPNKLRVLQSSKEILTDPKQRATYDASLTRTEAPIQTAPIAAPDAEPTFLQQWGKWLGIAVVAVGLVIVLTRHHEAPPVQAPVAKPAPIKPAEPVAASKPAVQPAAQAPAAAAPQVPSQDAAAEPVLGDWNCTDAISGRTSKYSFKEGGTLVIASTDGPAEYRFELAGRTLTLTSTDKVSTLVAEELAARKMILNTGTDGRRVVCKR